MSGSHLSSFLCDRTCDAFMPDQLRHVIGSETVIV